ncbi:unnamed protein product [Rotaria sp. Silwood1]|nr:unnamed protein product [Rotaria sp. Silwood1]
MVGGETQLLSLRISILYFLQSANKHTLGHLLTTGILSKDIVSSWCSFIALSHLIADSQESKETILLVKLPVDQTPTGAKTLMEISFDLLTNASSLCHTRIAILIFICTWLLNNSLAVQTFLSIDNTISYLISQIRTQAIANDLEILIQSLCSFTLEIFAQSKYYCNAQQQIHLTISEADELLIDHNFAQLFI